MVEGESTRPRPPVFEVEEALPPPESHARTDALPVAPVTIEVLARATADAVSMLYASALHALGAASALEAASILAASARAAATAALHAHVSPALAARSASAWAAVSETADSVWERAVDWWAAEVEGAGLDEGGARGVGSDESTAGSAPRASMGGDEDWEAVPPETAVGWVARE